MRNIVIVEDESLAAAHLEQALRNVLPEARVLAVLQSIEECADYFGGSPSPAPDLVFMDIHLADGSAFIVFDRVRIDCPVVFTTAYDQYALDAFRSGGVDYLLKPIAEDDLRRAVQKIERLAGAGAPQSKPAAQRGHQSFLLIPMQNQLVPVDLRKVACMYVEDRVTHIVMAEGRGYVVDSPLDTLMERLDPRLFYRANRQYIVAHSAIRSITVIPPGKLMLTLAVATPGPVTISKAKSPEFKEWYTL
ncbi:MAG: response regulator transcription factor [Bacteroidales bacterium]|nr:response regulator transcription factor [Bacteroidales bacterium]